MATNINIEGTPISKLPRELSPAGVDVPAVKSGITVKVSLDLLATKDEVNNIENNRKGYFSTYTELKKAYPTPEVGWYAYVGSTATIWNVQNDTWVDSGDPIPDDVDLSNLATKTELAQRTSIPIVFDKNGFIDLNGNIHNNYLGVYSDFIPVNTDTIINYTGGCTSTTLCIAGYSDNNPESFVTPLLQGTAFENKEVVITNSAIKYVVLSGITELGITKAIINVDYGNFAKNTDINQVNNSITKTNEKVSDIDDRLSIQSGEIAAKVDKINSKLFNDAGLPILYTQVDGDYPGTHICAGNDQAVWIGEKAASWMYHNGMHAFTISKENILDIVKGLVRYYPLLDANNVEIKFDRINGLDTNLPRYEMFNASGGKVMEIDTSNLFSLKHKNGNTAIKFDQTEFNIFNLNNKKNISIKNYGTAPGITINGHNESYGAWIGEKAASWMYYNGMYAFTTSKEDVLDIVKGFVRYYGADSSTELKFDRINGIDADAPQYEMYNKAGNQLLVIDKTGIMSLNHNNGKSAIMFNPTELSISDLNGNKNISLKNSGNAPGLILNGYKGAYGAWIGEKAASWMYYNGMYAFTTSKEDVLDIVKGFVRYYGADSSTELKFDRINGIDADSTQYEMYNKAGNQLLVIDKTGIMSLNHNNGKSAIMFNPTELSISDLNGNKNISLKNSGSTPGLILNGYKGAYGAWIGEKAASWMYHNGMYAFTTSKEDVLDIVKGFVRYYGADSSPELKFDRINGIDADAPQYEMYNKVGDIVMKIDEGGEFHLTKWCGKTLMFCGDSLMTGYPVSDYNMTDENKVREYGYPYLIGKRQNANIKLTALPNAVIRTGNINGGDLVNNKSRSLARTVPEADELFPPGSERTEAINFSYENSILPKLANVDLLFLGFGANDVEVDKVSATEWLPNSEFVTFDPSDPYNPEKFSIESRNRNTFIGATNYIIDAMLNVKPLLRFCFIAHPTNDDAQTNSDQHRRLNVITKALAEYWGVPYIDMYNKLGWSHKNNNPNSPLMKYCPDKIHFATADKMGLNYYSNILETALIQI